jgi:hypothetical protein
MATIDSGGGKSSPLGSVLQPETRTDKPTNAATGKTMRVNTWTKPLNED